MRIEIMIDKEQKISQQHWKVLSQSFTAICPSLPQKRSAYAREAPMA